MILFMIISWWRWQREWWWCLNFCSARPNRQQRLPAEDATLRLEILITITTKLPISTELWFVLCILDNIIHKQIHEIHEIQEIYHHHLQTTASGQNLATTPTSLILPTQVDLCFLRIFLLTMKIMPKNTMRDECSTANMKGFPNWPLFFPQRWTS